MASFASLPAELLHQVLGLIEDRMDLVSLSKANQTLREIATELLVESIKIRNWEGPNLTLRSEQEVRPNMIIFNSDRADTGLRELLLQLLSHPELANKAKTLNVVRSSGTRSVIDYEDCTGSTHRRDGLLANILRRRVLPWLTSDEERKTIINDASLGRRNKTDDACLAILLSLLPRLDSVVLPLPRTGYHSIRGFSVLEDGPVTHLSRFLHHHLGCSLYPTDSVHSVSLVSEPGISPPMRNIRNLCITGGNDGPRDVDFYNCHPFAFIRQIFDVASKLPKLQNLVIHQAVLEPDHSANDPLAKLPPTCTRLELNGCRFRRDLSDLELTLNACHPLKTFILSPTYEWVCCGNIARFGITEFLDQHRLFDIIGLHADSLENLQVRMQNGSGYAKALPYQRVTLGSTYPAFPQVKRVSLDLPLLEARNGIWSLALSFMTAEEFMITGAPGVKVIGLFCYLTGGRRALKAKNFVIEFDSAFPAELKKADLMRRMEEGEGYADDDAQEEIAQGQTKSFLLHGRVPWEVQHRDVLVPDQDPERPHWTQIFLERARERSVDVTLLNHTGGDEIDLVKPRMVWDGREVHLWGTTCEKGEWRDSAVMNM